MKRSNSDFIQDQSYASHFNEYKNVLSRFLNHDPEMFGLEKKQFILDLGCGYGDLLVTLHKRGYKHLLGIEPDPKFRKIFNEKGINVLNGSISKTNLKDNYVDVVIVNQVFHHIIDYQSAVEEISRILKPGGFLCFMEPSPTYLRKLMDYLTFETNLPKLSKNVNKRYQVMKLEVSTGAYPAFLNNQDLFYTSINSNFDKIWLRKSWFFQFGKYLNIKQKLNLHKKS
jgi:ubiquinone/menaquinone biosynthesis C-methylase UbiE